MTGLLQPRERNVVTDSGLSGGLFAAPRIVTGPGGPRDADGTVLLRSANPLGGYPVTVVHSLRTWAEAGPDDLLAAERGPDGAWQPCHYGAAVAAADSIGQALLDRGLGPGRPLLILSGTSAPHLLLTLGALTAGYRWLRSAPPTHCRAGIAPGSGPSGS